MRSKKSSQSNSPKLMKVSENSSGADLLKEGSDSAQSATQVPVDQVNLPTKIRSRRKMNLKKPLVKKDLKFSEKISNDESNPSHGSLHDTAPRFKVWFVSIPLCPYSDKLKYSLSLFILCQTEPV